MLRLLICSLLLAGFLLMGCNREDETILIQRAPKQPPPPVPVAASTSAEIAWDVPPGWKQLPAQEMRFATFAVSDQNPQVVLTVTSLGPESGNLLANVNRWEGQIGAPSTAEKDLVKVVQRVQIDGLPTDLVDLIGPETANPRQRMLGAILPHDDRVWFFKLSGPVEIVAAQKDNFDQFMKSVHFPGHAGHTAGASAPPAAAPEAAGSLPITFAAGADWVMNPPMPLRIVSFRVGEGEVIVSALPAASSGSRIDNINRWRGQVGLPAAKESDPQPSTPIIVGGIEGALFDLSGPERRQLMAWVPRGDQWWFFKLIGPADLVAKQQPAFDSFLKSVKFVGEKP